MRETGLAAAPGANTHTRAHTHTHTHAHSSNLPSVAYPPHTPHTPLLRLSVPLPSCYYSRLNSVLIKTDHIKKLMWLINWTLVEVPSPTSDGCIVEHFLLRERVLHIIPGPQSTTAALALFSNMMLICLRFMETLISPHNACRRFQSQFKVNKECTTKHLCFDQEETAL